MKGLAAASAPRPTLTMASFEGPLAALLHLIEKDDLDITTISLVDVADQYLAMLHEAEHVDAAALAEFVSIGSKLIYLKSRALLPRPESADELDDDEVAIDLTQALAEYRQFKQVAGLLREREAQGLRAYPRQGAAPELPLQDGLDDVTADALLAVFQQALTRVPKEAPTPIRVLERDPVTLRDKIDALRSELRRSGSISFRRMIERCTSRVEIVVQFLAVLELIKSHEIAVRQDALFSDIEIVAAGAAVTPRDGDHEAIA